LVLLVLVFFLIIIIIIIIVIIIISWTMNVVVWHLNIYELESYVIWSMFWCQYRMKNITDAKVKRCSKKNVADKADRFKFEGGLVFSNKKLFQSIFTRNVCIKVGNQSCFSKFLLLMITDRRIRMMQMNKKAVFFYHAAFAPQVRQQSVWLVTVRIIPMYY